jgi:hypothetical protein
MAFFALFWITISLIWTWVLVLLSWNNTDSSNEQKISAEQYAQLQKLIESQSWTTIDKQKLIESQSWTTIDKQTETITLTWTTK